VKIEILGTGCPKCVELAKNAEAAVRELGAEAEIVKVTDIVEIANRGVILPPALSIDGKIVVSEKVPTVSELKSLFRP
jgi:small redox-active disulfide protein 2